MEIAAILACLLALTRAEPPIGDGYPSSRSSSDHGYASSWSGHDHHNDHASSRSGFGDSYASARSGHDHYHNDFERGASNSYLPPSARSFSPSQSYGAPSARNEPSSQYGAPDFRSTLDEQYGAPDFRGASDSYSAPRSTYGAPSSRSNKAQGRGLSGKYGAPRNSPSSQYGAPRGLPQSYGTPEHNARSKTSAFSSSFASSRGAPSQQYGAPSARGLSDTYGAPGRSGGMPSDTYGAPDQHEAEKFQRALDELLSQEPANYDFGYKVSDHESGSNFGHMETRQEDRAQGSYFVVLPDGTKQVVEYEADERGFKPRISVERLDGGYDDNAHDAAGRSSGGPY